MATVQHTSAGWPKLLNGHAQWGCSQTSTAPLLPSPRSTSLTVPIRCTSPQAWKCVTPLAPFSQITFAYLTVWLAEMGTEMGIRGERGSGGRLRWQIKSSLTKPRVQLFACNFLNYAPASFVVLHTQRLLLHRRCWSFSVRGRRRGGEFRSSSGFLCLHQVNVYSKVHLVVGLGDQVIFHKGCLLHNLIGSLIGRSFRTVVFRLLLLLLLFGFLSTLCIDLLGEQEKNSLSPKKIREHTKRSIIIRLLFCQRRLR